MKAVCLIASLGDGDTITAAVAMMPQALYAEHLTSRAVSVKLYTEFIIPGLPSLLRGQSLIVQTLSRGIHRINHYPADR